MSSSTLEAEHEHLRVLLQRWLPVLRLQDWDIEIRYARAREFNTTEHVGGDVEWFKEKRSARIRVLDPQDHRTPPPMAPYDEEYTVVHELTHLHLIEWPHEGTGPLHVAEEQAVHVIATALVTLSRRVRELEQIALSRERIPDHELTEEPVGGVAPASPPEGGR